ncbi:methionine adenosyltransferase [Oscillospiraceae bacterium 38-13]
MRDNYILTAESVTEGHPDKLCDAIADSVLDACLKNDPAARVACEVMATAGKILVAGEITAAELPDIPAIVCRTVRETGYGSDYEVEVITHDQSGDIAGAVSQDVQMGVGDQGIVYGFACSETAELLPLPVVLAHRVTLLLTNARKTGTIQGLGPDGKAQVSVEYQGGKPHRIAAVVVSCQHDADKDMNELRREITRHVIVPALRDLYPDHKTEAFINPSGRFVLGGFEADTGLTGRKLMADTYGGLAPHGGGALSGKDGSKVDRSGAYMARYIAKNIVAAGLAERCTVSLAYAIGRAEPVAVDIDAHQTGKFPEAVLEQAVRAVFDLTPSGMISALELDQPIFARFCNYGHFTHQDAPWEQTDRATLLVDTVGGDRSNG